jgi:hypothetical protein
MVQTVWFIIRGCLRFVMVFFIMDVTRISIKRKLVSGDKADSLKRVWLNVNITMEAPNVMYVIKRQVNKDLCSIQELCHNICTLLNTCGCCSYW